MSINQIAIQSNIWQNNSVLKQKRQNQSKQNYMPFLFRSKRQFPFIKNQQIPPVGAYKVSNTFDSTKNKLESLGYEQNVLKQQFIKQNQMVIFKSKQSRFNSNVNNMPGPASYNFQQNGSPNMHKSNRLNAKNYLMQIQSKLQQNHINSNIIKRAPSCPTIPSSNIKYGYLKDATGNFKTITKTDEQLQKQKKKLKQYSSTLVNQNIYEKLNASKLNNSILKNSKIQLEKSSPHKNFTTGQLSKKEDIKHKLEKYIPRNKFPQILLTQGPNKHQNSILQQNLKLKNQKSANKKITRPKVKLSHGVNLNAIMRDQSHLGPGCYNVSLNTLKKGQKVQTFQFFGSTQKRFTLLEKQNAEHKPNPYEYLFKQKKNFKTNTKPKGKIYKKSLPYSFNPDEVQRQLQKPGPGYYQPQYETVKKIQACPKFGYQTRFKSNIPKNSQSQQIQQQLSSQRYKQSKQRQKIWGNLRKQKIQAPQIRYQAVKQQQIYGIMNQQPQNYMQSPYSELKKGVRDFSNTRNKQSAVFLDRSQRFNPYQNTYYQGDGSIDVIQSFNNLHNTKGSFVSKFSKSENKINKKQNTPGPGSYQSNKLLKKSFNLKSC